MQRFVMGRGRSPAFLALVLALFLALSGLGYAATRGDLTVGRINKTSKGTTLRSRGGPTLTLTNTGGKPAARFNVLRGKPPFAVNSRTKVTGLDADLLDGLDSSRFQTRVAGTCAAGSAIRVVNADGSVVCASTLSTSWSLTGNAGTSPATNFLGTTDAQPLVIRTNNAEVLRVSVDGNLGVGTTTPGARVDASATNGIAVNGTSTSGDGVDGTSTSGNGLKGTSSAGTGVAGVANGTVAEPGVTGTSSLGDGVEGTSNLSNAGVLGKSGNGVGVEGESTNGAGAAVGVLGLSGTQPGVLGQSNGSDGVRGTANTGNGVNGLSDSGSGLNGSSSSGTGVSGHSSTQDGVSGTSDSSTGVHGGATSGVGVSGDSTSADGVIGISFTANGVGGSSDSGAGLSGASKTGDGVRGLTNHPSGGSTAAAVDAINTGGGDIFIGQHPEGTHVARIDSSGKGFFDGGTQNSGADYAESMRTSGNTKTLAPGDVLALDPQHPDQVRLSNTPASRFVAGVYSTKPSVLAVGSHGIGDSLAGEVPVAMLGIVPTKVSAENGAVKPGDLLVTARTAGYAMKASSVVMGGVALYPTGAILGKALEPLREGSGVVEVLVTLR